MNTENIPFDFNKLKDPRLDGWYPTEWPNLPEGAILKIVHAYEFDDGELFDDDVSLLVQCEIEFAGDLYDWDGVFRKKYPVTVRLLSHAANYIIWLLDENDPDKLNDALLKVANEKISRRTADAAAKAKDDPNIGPLLSVTAYDKDDWPLGVTVEHGGISLPVDDLRKTIRAITGYRTIRKMLCDVDPEVRAKIEDAVGGIAADAFEAGRAFRQAELKSEHQYKSIKFSSIVDGGRAGARAIAELKEKHAKAIQKQMIEYFQPLIKDNCDINGPQSIEEIATFMQNKWRKFVGDQSTGQPPQSTPYDHNYLSKNIIPKLIKSGLTWTRSRPGRKKKSTS
jgi:hypothetical protein